jgi:DNA-binding transcriptional LysR family regulator
MEGVLMTLDQLRYFLAAAQFEHIGKAALFVNISPSVVSQSIKALEDEIGYHLFQRKAKRIWLSKEGHSFQKKVRAILDQVSELKASSFENEDESGTYRLAASQSISGLLATAWSRLQKANPKIVGTLSSLNTHTIVGQLLAGELDAGYCFSPIKHPDLAEQVLYRGQFLIVTRKNHPLQKQSKSKILMALSEYPAVLHMVSRSHDIDANYSHLKKLGVLPKVCMSFDSGSLAAIKLSLSDAWAILPDTFVTQNASSLKALALPEEWNFKYSISLIKHKGTPDSKILTNISEGIQALLRSPTPQ